MHRGHSPTPGGPQGRAPTGLGSGPGVTGTGNARVSVPGQGLEVEARVSGRHNSRPLRLLTPRGESHRRGPRAGAPCGTSSLSTARQGKKPLELPTHPHTQKTDRFSRQLPHPPTPNLRLIGLQTWTSPTLPHPFRPETAFTIPPSPVSGPDFQQPSLGHIIKELPLPGLGASPDPRAQEE